MGVPEPRNIITPTYVEKWEVLDFIEEVRKADKDNFVIRFSDPNDIGEQLKGRLRGLSRHLLSQIVSRQCDFVKNIKTTTGMAFSLGDVLSQGYFIDPPYIVKSGRLDGDDGATELITKLQTEETCIALLGQPGSGKSTLMGKAFMEHAKQSLELKSNRLPFYVPLRGRGIEYPFSLMNYINDCFNTLFDKDMFPQIDLSQVEPVYYMDAFDEISENIGQMDFRILYNSDMFKRPFILTCRSRFATEYLNEVTFGNRLSHVIELVPWDWATAQQYIREFCRLQGHDDLVIEIEKIFDDQPGMDEISANPLFLTLFLWVVQESEMTPPLDVQNIRTLMDACLGMWAKRELARLGLNGTPEGKVTAVYVIHGWEIGAWEIYRSRFKAKGMLTMTEMLVRISEMRPELEQICNAEMFLGLFDIRPYSKEVIGMLHEQLLEHLTASAIVRGMQENIYPFPDSLSHAIRFEINRIVRSILKETSKEGLEIILKHLWSSYNEALGKDNAISVMQRNQASYYIGRLGLQEVIDYLRIANEKENNLFVKLSIGFGLIKLGQIDVEEDLYTKLVEDDEWDVGNRGYHLVYYRDLQTDESPPYRDEGKLSWVNTLNALLRHIESNEERHIAMRRVELLTIRRLMVARENRGPLDEETLHRIERAIRGVEVSPESNIPTDFYAKAENEFEKLRKSWEEIDK
jgi:hypothetical protein